MNNTTLNSTENILNVHVTWTNILTGIILYSIVLLTIFGNLLVLVAVYVNKNLQTTFNYYVVNLAVTDFAVALTAMSFHTTDNVLGYWPFGAFLCGVWIFFDYGMTFVSVFTLILISLDRFWSVTWSNHYRLHHSKRKCIAFILFIWIFMLILWLPPCIYDRIHHAKPGECIWEPSLNTGFVIVVATIGHHGSCFIMLFCYIKVFIFMRKHRRMIANVSDSKPTDMEGSAVWNVDNGASTNYVKETPTEIFRSSALERSEINETKIPTKNVTTNNLHVPMCLNSSFRMNTRNLQKTRRRKRDTAIFITLTYVVIGYAVCWIPFHIVFDISSVCPSCVPKGVFAVTFWMTYINSTINPFLYNFSNSEFKQTFKSLLHVFKR